MSNKHTIVDNLLKDIKKYCKGESKFYSEKSVCCELAGPPTKKHPTDSKRQITTNFSWIGKNVSKDKIDHVVVDMAQFYMAATCAQHFKGNQKPHYILIAESLAAKARILLNSFRHENGRNNILVLAFDNTRKTTIAKIPTQRSRKKLPENLKKNVNVNFKPNDELDENWRSFLAIPKFAINLKKMVIDYIKSDYQLKCEKRAAIFLWSQGEMTQLNDVQANNKVIVKSELFNSVGEFDHFFVRYISVHTKDTKVQNLQSQPNEHCFRIYSTDTDIFLYILYLLECVDHENDLKNDVLKLPRIFWIKSRGRKRNSRAKNPKPAFVQIDMSKAYYLMITKSDLKKLPPYGRMRNLCTFFFSWSNDYLKNPFGIGCVVYRKLLKFHINIFKKLPLTYPITYEYNNELYTMNWVSSKSICVFYDLMFYAKFFEVFNDARLRSNQKPFSPKDTTRSPRALQDWMHAYKAKKLAENKKGVPLTNEKKLRRANIVKATIYFLDHAMLNIPFHDQGIQTVEFREIHDASDQYNELFTSDEKEKLKAMGFFGSNSKKTYVSSNADGSIPKLNADSLYEKQLLEMDIVI